jgi:hypothetical protein
LDEERRRLLLPMSAATADRLLQAHRYVHPRGLSTTKARPPAQTAGPDPHFRKVGMRPTWLVFRSN